MRLKMRGFSAVEALLAVTVFGLLVTALAGAFVYGQSASAGSGERARANALAEEGIEAVRNTRDGAYANLTDGTYGLVQSGNVWTLSGSSDVTGIFTRQVTIATTGTLRRSVTSTVSWPQGVSSAQVSVSSELTSWPRTKSWASPALLGSADLTGTLDGLKVATQGTYAYMVRTDGTPDFAIINTATPTAPTVVGTLTLTGAPSNIAVSGNYAYITTNNTAGEVVVVDISTPSAPVLKATYNAAGTAAGQGIFINGNYAYVTRAANGGTSEFIILNISTPTAPTLAGSYGNNLSMREVWVTANTAFVVTDTGRLLAIAVGTPSSPTLTSNTALAGTGTALTIDGFNNTAVIGRGTGALIYNVASPSAPSLLSNTTLAGALNDVEIDPTNSYAYFGTSSTTAEFQVLNITNTSSPVIAASFDVAGTSSTVNGVAYNISQDIVVGASASDTQEALLFGAN